MRDNLTPVQLHSLRWIVLQVIEAGAPYVVTERMCLDAVAAAYPAAGAERLRVELGYLEAGGLIALERSEIRPWEAKLTGSGRDVVDYAVDAPRGVWRPQRAPEGL